MARNPSFVSSAETDEMTVSRLAPTKITKQEFGRRLYKLMHAKNWSQSDLARAAFGTIKDTEGRTVARRRDSVSSYLKGTAFPDSKSRELLAKALGITVEELLPNAIIDQIEREEPALEIKQSGGHTDKVYLRINQLVTYDQAMQIAAILKK